MSVNNLSSLWQSVIGAATEASKVLKPTHNAASTIYWDTRPEQSGILGQTVNVPFPVDPTGAVIDIGVGDVPLSDIRFDTKPIVIDKHPIFAFTVKDFEQFNTPLLIRQTFMDAALTGIMNHINARITGMFTTANFTTNTPVSATSHVVTVPQFLAARAVLSDQKVPIDSVGMMSCLLPSTPYMTMMDGTTGGPGAAWSQAFIVGQNTASTIHEDGRVPVAFSTKFLLDQQMPTSGSVGSRTFTGAYFHKFAVAGATRAIPTPDEAGKVAEYMYLDFNGIRIRVMLGYNQYPKLGLVVTIDAAYGLSILRENMGVILSIAE